MMLAKQNRYESVLDAEGVLRAASPNENVMMYVSKMRHEMAVNFLEG